MINSKLALRKSAIVGFSAISLSAFGLSAQAASLVQNGGFIPTGLSGSARLNSSVTLPGWNYTGASGTSDFYNFLVPDGSAFATNMAALGNSSEGALSLYSSAGQTVVAPGGSGWFIAADGVYNQGPISQTLNGLKPGQEYTVTFYQAAGQQLGFTGDTTEWWQVSFGSVSRDSTIIRLPSESPVTGWQTQVMKFTADNPTQILSFLAKGTPDGRPPFSLLAGISVNPTSVPEPFTFVGTMIGLGLGARLRSKLKKSKSQN